MYFPSKKDTWLTILLWGVILLFIITPILSIQIDQSPLTQVFEIFITSLLAVFIAWIWFKTGYTIEDTTLKVVCGPFKKNVLIHEINGLRKTKNPFSAPALSTDRLELSYGKVKVLTISPEDEAEFIRMLLKKNPEIKLWYNKSSTTNR
ncbi:PH domain-containing protein [Alkalihalophilus pseudofirmus]|uniref:PH domain-containing protein n=1 Tax=Alkalihalophilus pseudofirmus TaxID=79885 RepID=A0AAJ2KRT5_ALKPS|nr:PH domain-containing protein [Alkalihalophilus pseudofirmus]MDV2883677.1 PH domain-containing protein [Alkalihalophilus pseudofirmus]